MISITDFYEHQECPGVNGIYYPDGSVQLLNVSEGNSTLNKYVINLLGKATIKDLEDRNEITSWNDCAILFKKKFPDLNIEVLAGESDYGSDGFVAVFDGDCQQLNWVAFFDCSNPFKEVYIDGDCVVALSTNGLYWKFPLKSPANASVFNAKK